MPNRYYDVLVKIAALIGVVLAWLVLPVLRAEALRPDQIVLIVNKNVPEGRKLADLYCELRSVPAGHIVELDLSSDEEMPFADYETKVVLPVREFLIQQKLVSQTTCLLTFYGVPFRVGAKINSPDEQKELADLLAQQATLLDSASQAVSAIEAQAAQLDDTFHPSTDATPTGLQGRVQAAGQAIALKIQAMNDIARQTQETGRLMSQVEKLGGPVELEIRMGAQQRAVATKSPEDHQHWVDLQDRVVQAVQTLRQLQAIRWDPAARAQLRAVSTEMFGFMGALHVVEAQIAYFATDDTVAATDNELALLWWDYYPRKKWQLNALNYHVHARTPPVMMAMRLDGPDAATVERMIRTSVEVEKNGLQGIIAIDSRGKPPTDAYGVFDEKLRHLSEIVRTKTQLKQRFDDQDIVFPPHSVKDVGLYCGWYSVGNYIPGCDFGAGAVGYHVASFELVRLHNPTNGWVRGLLTDGVVATLGAVAEPDLAAFPLPDEFFPLLLTGKLPLAEVYWKTTPMTSWMIACIGDPLYTPYKANPGIRVEDLPENLQAVLVVPVPATQPGQVLFKQ